MAARFKDRERGLWLGFGGLGLWLGVLSNGIITNWVFCASRHQANQSFGKKKQPLRKNGSVFKKSESESEPRGGYKYTGHWTRFHFLAKSQTLKLSEAEDFIVKKRIEHG